MLFKNIIHFFSLFYFLNYESMITHLPGDLENSEQSYTEFHYILVFLSR